MTTTYIKPSMIESVVPHPTLVWRSTRNEGVGGCTLIPHEPSYSLFTHRYRDVTIRLISPPVFEVSVSSLSRLFMTLWRSTSVFSRELSPPRAHAAGKNNVHEPIVSTPDLVFDSNRTFPTLDRVFGRSISHCSFTSESRNQSQFSPFTYTHVSLDKRYDRLRSVVSIDCDRR